MFHALGRAADVWRFGQYHLLWISRTMSSVQMCSVSSSLIYSIAKYCNFAHTWNIPERKPSQGQPSVQLFDVLILGNATMPETRDIMKETWRNIRYLSNICGAVCTHICTCNCICIYMYILYINIRNLKYHFKGSSLWLFSLSNLSISMKRSSEIQPNTSNNYGKYGQYLFPPCSHYIPLMTWIWDGLPPNYPKTIVFFLRK